MRRFFESILLSLSIIGVVFLCLTSTAPAAGKSHAWSLSSNQKSLPLTKSKESSTLPAPLPTINQGLGQAVAVYDWQAETYYDDVAAAQAAQAAALAQQQAAARASQSSSGTTTQQSSPAQPLPESGGDNAAIWACIVQHESGGNPTVMNSQGSGAAGLYQFELGTWLSPSIIAITGGYPGGANTAPASVQTEAAYSYEAQNGWSAWRGDGCTPDG